MVRTTRKAKPKGALTGKARRHAELAEITRLLRRHGAANDVGLEKTTITMLDKDTLPKVKALSPGEITAVREHAGVSQAVMAAFMNVAVSTISQWERGERRPTGTALKLLHVVKSMGLESLGFSAGK